MKAVIMAGGKGTRLRPLTENIPKPMVTVCNRPVLEYTLELLKRHKITEVIITLQYKAEEIRSYLGDGSRYGMNISYSIEDEPLGTAGSVKKVENFIGNETFLVISGDGLTDIDLGLAVTFHNEKGAKATLILKEYDKPVEYGIVIIDKEGNIKEFTEKPSWDEVNSNHVNTGIYILEPSIFSMMEPNKAYDFSKEIFLKILKDGEKICGYVADGYWCDIGDVDHYAQAHRDVLDGEVKLEMVGQQIRDGIWIGEGTQIGKDVKLVAPLMIGRDCNIGDNVQLSEYTCIGNNCHIGDFSKLDRNIILDNVFMGRNTESIGGIIGRRCIIKPGVTINDGAVIGDNVKVGSSSIINKEVQIWSNKFIADGTTVFESIKWGEKSLGSLFGQRGISGIGNVEISPQFAMRLGAAFGSILSSGSTVAIARDAHPVCRLINRSIISGLSSVGINILDLRLLPIPASRYIISQQEMVVGGIHTHINHEDQQVEIEFFDSCGINIRKSDERSLENIFTRQDFRCMDEEDVGLISYLDNDSIEIYKSNFIKNVNAQSIAKAKFKIVVDYSYGCACQIFPFILNKLGVDAVSINAYVDFKKAKEVQENKDNKQVALDQLGLIVKSLKADFGVLIVPSAETFYLIDENGKLIRGNNLLALMALMVFRRNKGASVAVPMNVPNVLEKVAEEQSGNIVRTKRAPRSVMRALKDDNVKLAGNSSGAFVFPQFSAGFDAMFAIAQLLEMIALDREELASENKDKIFVSEFMKLIPEHYSLSDKVYCEWSKKAKVMRLLAERYSKETLDFKDGLHVSFKDGSSYLFTANASLAQINVWVDASSKQIAKELLDRASSIVMQLASANEEEIYHRLESINLLLSPTTEVSEEMAFNFWVPGHELGIRANSLRSFIDVLRTVDVASLKYHMERKDFSNWLDKLGFIFIAMDFDQLREFHYEGEKLRNYILHCLVGFGSDQQVASSSEYSSDDFSEDDINSSLDDEAK